LLCKGKLGWSKTMSINLSFMATRVEKHPKLHKVQLPEVRHAQNRRENISTYNDEIRVQ
jgi:hypothetical protein